LLFKLSFFFFFLHLIISFLSLYNYQNPIVMLVVKKVYVYQGNIGK
jgi:hypothetical protein